MTVAQQSSSMFFNIRYRPYINFTSLDIVAITIYSAWWKTRIIKCPASSCYNYWFSSPYPWCSHSTISDGLLPLTSDKFPQMKQKRWSHGQLFRTFDSWTTNWGCPRYTFTINITYRGIHIVYILVKHHLIPVLQYYLYMKVIIWPYRRVCTLNISTQ